MVRLIGIKGGEDMIDVVDVSDAGVLITLPNQNVKTVVKPWGKEEWLPSGDYLFKRLTMYKDHRCSLQLHNFKAESIYVLSGTLKLTVRVNEPDYHDTDFILESGDFFYLSPKTIHRMSGITECVYLEASTNHPDDVLRLQTDYPEPEDVHVELVDGDPDFLGMGTFSSVLSELKTGNRNWSPPVYCSDFPPIPCNPPDPSPELIEMVNTRVNI